MRTRRGFCRATLAMGCSLVCSPLRSQSAPADFTPLFDGHSFAGWEGNAEVFRIEGGVNIGARLSAPVARNEYLCTTRRYANFECA